MYEKPNLPKQMHHLRLCHNRIRCSNHTLVCHMENESRLGFIFTSGFQKHLIAAFLRKSKSHPRMLHGRTRSPNASVEFIFTKISRPLQIWLFQGVSKNSHLFHHIRPHSRHTALCMKPIRTTHRFYATYLSKPTDYRKSIERNTDFLYNGCKRKHHRAKRERRWMPCASK